jgi:hypothetical protein
MDSLTPNPLHPNHLTANERLAELGPILTRGLIWLRDRVRHSSLAYPISRAQDRVKNRFNFAFSNGDFL